MHQSMITDWKTDYVEKFSNEPLLLHHRLSESGLFDHDVLADVIENYPSSHYNLTTMGYDPLNPVWREGVIQDVPGKSVIEAIKAGRMWLNLRKIEEIDSRYRNLLKDIFDEFEEYVPEFRSYKQKMGILISSPKVQVFYHMDVPGQSLWQVEGKKRVFVYPNEAPYLMPENHERVVLGETEEEIPYDPDFDKGAQVYDLVPGEMVHWPLNCPHRVLNEDCLNISVTTEHWTDDIRNYYAMNYANGVLRNRFGFQDLSRKTSGPAFLAKAALAVAWRKLRLNEAHNVRRMVDFTVNPDAENGIIEIPAYAK